MQSIGALFNVKNKTLCWNSHRELPMKKGEIVLVIGLNRVINNVHVIDILRNGDTMTCLFDDIRPVKK